jgi:hypothetical protein
MLWLWCQLSNKGYVLDESRVIDSNSRAFHLIEKIKESNVETVADLRRYNDECFSGRLDDQDFKWIDFNNRRLVFWIIWLIDSRSLLVEKPMTPFDQSILSPRERIQLAFDLSSLTIKGKKETLSYLHDSWSQLIAVDASLDWLSRRDDDQCIWLVNELSSSDFSCFVSPDLQYPVNNDERILVFLNALDRSGVSLNLKRLYLKELKSKWRRRQKKLDGNKVQCNLNVDLLTKENIKNISAYRGVKMGELIDALIVEEVERLKSEGVVF